MIGKLKYYAALLGQTVSNYWLSQLICNLFVSPFWGNVAPGMMLPSTSMVRSTPCAEGSVWRIIPVSNSVAVSPTISIRWSMPAIPGEEWEYIINAQSLGIFSPTSFRISVTSTPSSRSFSWCPGSSSPPVSRSRPKNRGKPPPARSTLRSTLSTAEKNKPKLLQQLQP